ncbi:MAG: multicopper oxidase domain-containing protein [Desulfosarcinaceae bacterium]|nr:multicopper oxidase domain-containing protein [Desulfosarcinaceae bacterium]
MKAFRYYLPLILALFLLAVMPQTWASIAVQCPEDTDGIDADGDGDPANDIVCRHITGGDGFATMADGRRLYMFSFGDADDHQPLDPAGPPVEETPANKALEAELPAPRITLREGQELYLTMTNVSMVLRPDLFDPHSVHWHGFPNAAPIFDGLPEPSPTPNMMASFTYYYKAAHPGTYFYHCHVEAAEHMQMGMIGNLWVTPKQNELPDGTVLLGGFVHNAGNKYAYNDGDGSTFYDVEIPIQMTGMDSAFHDASEFVTPLMFAEMHDNYTMINGRGYPDTMDPNVIFNQDGTPGFGAQKTPTLIDLEQGQILLMRVSNVSTTHIYSMATTTGVPMKVVGRGAALLRGPTGEDTSFEVNVLNVGGGQAFDVLLDTQDVPPGKYFLYTTTLQFLANGDQERGGIMTEINVSAAP